MKKTIKKKIITPALGIMKPNINSVVSIMNRVIGVLLVIISCIYILKSSDLINLGQNINIGELESGYKILNQSMMLENSNLVWYKKMYFYETDINNNFSSWKKNILMKNYLVLELKSNNMNNLMFQKLFYKNFNLTTLNIMNRLLYVSELQNCWQYYLYKILNISSSLFNYFDNKLLDKNEIENYNYWYLVNKNLINNNIVYFETYFQDNILLNNLINKVYVYFIKYKYILFVNIICIEIILFLILYHYFYSWIKVESNIKNRQNFLSKNINYINNLYICIFISIIITINIIIYIIYNYNSIYNDPVVSLLSIIITSIYYTYILKNINNK